MHMYIYDTLSLAQHECIKTAQETGRALCMTYVLDTLHAASTHVYIAGIAQVR